MSNFKITVNDSGIKGCLDLKDTITITKPGQEPQTMSIKEALLRGFDLGADPQKRLATILQQGKQSGTIRFRTSSLLLRKFAKRATSKGYYVKEYASDGMKTYVGQEQNYTCWPCKETMVESRVMAIKVRQDAGALKLVRFEIGYRENGCCGSWDSDY